MWIEVNSNSSILCGNSSQSNINLVKEIITVQSLALCFEIQKLSYENTDIGKEAGSADYEFKIRYVT